MPTCLPANVPKMCQLLIFMYQRAIICANFSSWCANVAKNVPIFQTFLLRNVKGNFYTLLLYNKFYIILDIILIHIRCICIIHINCIILYFLKLFCSLVKKENIKRPCFFTFLVTRVFSNFPQLNH